MIYGIITLGIFLVVSLYINYILYRKVVFFENWFENMAEIVERIYENMNTLDERGVMRQDDAFGHFFSAMKEMMLELFSMGFYNEEDLEGLKNGLTEQEEGQSSQKQQQQRPQRPQRQPTQDITQPQGSPPPQTEMR